MDPVQTITFEIAATSQVLTERGDCGCERQTIGRSRVGATIDGLLDQATVLLVRALEAQFQEAQLRRADVACGDRRISTVTQRVDALAARSQQRDFVQRGDGVAGTDVAGVDGVVVEVLALKHAVLVADQAVFGDHGRVELELDLDVPGDREQGRGEFVDQHLARFVQGVDIGVVAVAGVGQLFHQVVVVVASAEAQRGQLNASLATMFNHVLQCLEADRADVEVAVCGEDHAVDAVFDKALLCLGIGQLDAGCAMRRTAGRQAIESAGNAGVLITRGRFEHHAAGAGVDHDGDAVIGVELTGQHLQRIDQQR